MVNKLRNFEFIKNIKIKKDIENFYFYILFLYDELLKNKDNYSKGIKILKKHTIVVYLGSLIEAVLYDFVENKIKKKEKYLKNILYIPLKEFEIKRGEENLYLCNKKEINIDFKDDINNKLSKR